MRLSESCTLRNYTSVQMIRPSFAACREQIVNIVPPWDCGVRLIRRQGNIEFYGSGV